MRFFPDSKYTRSVQNKEYSQWKKEITILENILTEKKREYKQGTAILRKKIRDPFTCVLLHERASYY